MQRQFHSWIQALSEWLKNAAVTFLWVLCSHLSGEMWWEMGDGSCSCGFCLHRVHQHQPWPCWSPVHINHTVHALTVLIPEKARKEFCFVLTGLTSYSVNSNMIHGDRSENRNGTVIFLSCTSGGKQWDNNGNHTTELHEFISHQSLWKGFSRTCKYIFL